jgi:hypothetical protein
MIARISPHLKKLSKMSEAPRGRTGPVGIENVFIASSLSTSVQPQGVDIDKGIE